MQCKYIWKKTTAALCLAGTMLLTGCGEVDLSSTKAELEPVMTINGFAVPFELYRYVALNYKDQYESGLTQAEAGRLWTGEEGAALLEELEENTIETLKNLYATIAYADEYGITEEDPVVTESVDVLMEEIYEGYEQDMDLYLQTIREHHMNDGVYRALTRNTVLTEELFYAMLNAGDIISDEEVLRDMIESDQFVRVKQILIAADNGNSAEENRRTAEDLLARLDAGENFDALLDKYGEDLFMFNNDDGYYIIRGNRYEAFEDAAFRLQIGEYSDVIETDAGFSILLRCEKEQEYMDTHFDDLCQEYFDAAYNLQMSAYVETLTVETLPLYEQYTIFNME